MGVAGTWAWRDWRGRGREVAQQGPDPALLLVTGCSIPFSGEQCSETKIWALGWFAGTE